MCRFEVDKDRSTTGGFVNESVASLLYHRLFLLLSFSIRPSWLVFNSPHVFSLGLEWCERELSVGLIRSVGTLIHGCVCVQVIM